MTIRWERETRRGLIVLSVSLSLFPNWYLFSPFSNPLLSDSHGCLLSLAFLSSTNHSFPPFSVHHYGEIWTLSAGDVSQRGSKIRVWGWGHETQTHGWERRSWKRMKIAHPLLLHERVILADWWMSVHNLFPLLSSSNLFCNWLSLYTISYRVSSRYPCIALILLWFLFSHLT